MRSGWLARDDLIAARELQRRLVRLGARVAEEHAALEGAPRRAPRPAAAAPRCSRGSRRESGAAPARRWRRPGRVPVAQHARRRCRRSCPGSGGRRVVQRAPLPALHDDGRLSVIVDEQAAARLDEIVLPRHRPTLPLLRCEASASAAPMGSAFVRPQSAGHPQHRHGGAGALGDAGGGQGAAARGVRPAGAAAGRGDGAVRPRRGRAAVQRRAAGPPGRAAPAGRDPGALPRARAARWDARSPRAGARRARASAGSDDRSDHHRVVHRDHDPVARRLPGRRPGLRPDVRRLPITELGCAGGAAALARARDFLVGFPDARALVVAVELPSLSMQRADLSLANLVATALFGDGAAAAVLAGGERAPATRPARSWRRCRTSSRDSTYALGFDLKDDGFHSVLSKDIPVLLQAARSRRLVDALAARRGLVRGDLGCFVLHPGGRKILGVVEEELGLSRDDTQPSWDVLRDYGNQSSASVLFVLHEWLTQRRPPARRARHPGGVRPGPDHRDAAARAGTDDVRARRSSSWCWSPPSAPAGSSSCACRRRHQRALAERRRARAARAGVPGDGRAAHRDPGRRGRRGAAARAPVRRRRWRSRRWSLVGAGERAALLGDRDAGRRTGTCGSCRRCRWAW